MKTFKLRSVSASDQRIPCSAVVDDEFCHARATFNVYPECSCTPEDGWPRVQTCTEHLARTLRTASKLCASHFGGRVLRVWPR